jgi:predicted dehydrogenase
MKAIQLGVIGYGGRGRALFHGCGLLDGVECVAVCDANPEVADFLRREHPAISFFPDYLAMLDSGTVNAVLVETPPQFHAACAMAALERNIHVLSDVPAIHAIAEAGPLWQAARDSRAIYMFGANPNYWDFVAGCLDLKRQGLLGQPFYLEAEYVHDIRELALRTAWRQNFEPIRYCTHSLGPLLKWIDEDLEWVSCFDTHSHVTADPAAHDAMVALFRTKSRVVVKLLCTFVNNHPHSYHRYVCHGTKGYFEHSSPGVDGEVQSFFATVAGAGVHALQPLPVTGIPRTETLPPQLDGHGGADGAMLTDFVTAIRQHKPSPIDVREALRMTLPGLYALESSRQGGTLLRIDYPWSEPAEPPAA